MALTTTSGYTDDGLVFLRFEGQQKQFGKPVESVITMEPDHAEKLAHCILDAAKKAMMANKRPLLVGQEQTFKRG